VTRLVLLLALVLGVLGVASDAKAPKETWYVSPEPFCEVWHRVPQGVGCFRLSRPASG